MLNSVIVFSYFLDFLISFIENYLIISLINIFFIKKKDYTLINSLFFTIISIIVNQIIYPPIFSSLFLLLLLYIYTFLFLEGNLKSKIFMPILVYANLFIINILISLVPIFFSIKPENFLSTLSFEYFIISFFTKAILFFEYMFLKKYKSKDIYITKETWILSILLIIISMFFPMIYYNEYLSGNIKSFNIVIFSLLEFIIINVLIYIILIKTNNDHKKIMEQEILLETKKYETQMYKLIDERIETYNKINHDMNNHKLVIQKMLEDKNKNVEIQNYFNNIFPNISDTYVNTQNKILNYILDEKIKNAKESNIDIKCMIQGNLQDSIAPIDLSIVVGNLLDNAIEATKNANKKFINVDIFQDEYKLIITVKNSYAGEINESHETLLTTKHDIQHHGYGLSNIKQICQKYDGYNQISYHDHIFSHTCVFLLNKSNEPS